MSSTNKTDLGFNQWVLSDKPTMHDYNADNQLADDLIGALEEKLEGVDSVAEALAGKVDVSVDGMVHPMWNPLSLQNGFDSRDSLYYTKINGIVYLRGNIRPNTTSGNIIFATLPTGFRPGYYMRLVAPACMSTDSVSHPTLITIDALGQMTMCYAIDGAIKPIESYSLDHISFFASH